MSENFLDIFFLKKIMIIYNVAWVYRLVIMKFVEVNSFYF